MKKSIWIILAIMCGFFIGAFVIYIFSTAPKKYKAEIENYSAAYNLDSALVFAIARTESGFKSDALSKAGAVGVMQIMPKTAEWIALKNGEEFEVNNLYDADLNIRYGCFYLRYLFDKFQDVWVVVAAYNAGESNVLRWVDESGNLDEEKIDFSETKNYVKKVKTNYKLYKK